MARVLCRWGLWGVSKAAERQRTLETLGQLERGGRSFCYPLGALEPRDTSSCSATARAVQEQSPAQAQGTCGGCRAQASSSAVISECVYVPMSTVCLSRFTVHAVSGVGPEGEQSQVDLDAVNHKPQAVCNHLERTVHQCVVSTGAQRSQYLTALAQLERGGRRGVEVLLVQAQRSKAARGASLSPPHVWAAVLTSRSCN
ncbi:hypothetical protein H920_00134 [Fukomys damarensis]|uniref:Uncharacterized protein n=1 Tax=Fukomys damarensis TaxID=885580 RepID=A0A091E791_FUKDA|nr:hypothetical protein H920_00134 [Fukomys damarensis]